MFPYDVMSSLERGEYLVEVDYQDGSNTSIPVLPSYPWPLPKESEKEKVTTDKDNG